MPDTTDRPAPMAFSHPTTEEPRRQAGAEEDPAARDVEFTAPAAAQTAARPR